MRYCIKCKVEYAPCYDRSFHALPKDLELKKKWLSILNLPDDVLQKQKVVVCSDHFCRENFFEDEERLRRRLKPGAVPVSSFATECVENLKSVTGIVATEADNNIYEIDNIASETCQDIMVPVSSSEFIKSIKSSAVIECIDKFNVVNTLQYNIVEPDSSELINDVISTVEPESKNQSDVELTAVPRLECNTKKRKKNIENSNATKKIRIMEGHKIDYLSRADFSSEKSWKKFLIYKKSQDNKLTAARSKNFRCQKIANSKKCYSRTKFKRRV